MRRVLAATVTEFFELQPLGCRLPVLGGRIIPLFAITALHRNNFSGHCSLPVVFVARAPSPASLCRCCLQSGRGRPLHTFTYGYCTISEIVPAPTVCPPSRIAKRKPFSIATGVISSITRLTLSPGITISVPAGNSATPVTSVVRR